MSSTPSRMVLLVDEDASVQDVLARALEARGYEVRRAGDGPAASALLGVLEGLGQAPDLLIGDIMMPTADGASLAHLVRDHAGLRAVPIIFLAARLHAEAVLHTMSLGVRHCIQKPFSLRDVVAKVDRLLR